MMRFFYNQKGFTLVEVLVAMSIFSILTVVVSGIFVNVSNLHRQTANLQRLQNDGRYMIEKIAREIRSREVDYPLSNPRTCLLFKPDELGNILMVQYIADGKIGYSLDQLEKNCDAEPASWAVLNATDVEVKNLQFVVSPLSEDQWNQQPEDNVQPRVTVLLTIANRDVVDKHRQEVTLQTTISSKLYKR